MDLQSKRSVKVEKRGYYSELVTGTGEHTGNLQKYQPPIARRETGLSWRVLESTKSPPVRNLKTARLSGHVIDNERWITFPTEPSIDLKYIKKSFPGESFNPKVQMECELGPRRLVRNVEVERRRRKYKSVPLEQLLLEENIRASDILESDFLPIEIFDNNDFDCRTPEEWWELSTIDGKRYPLPAEALIEISYKHLKRMEELCPNEIPKRVLYSWQPVAVLETDNSQVIPRWKVMTLDGEQRIYYLPRIYFRYFAEDPRIFVKRVTAALLERSIAVSSLNYNLYLDCMPYEGMLSLNDSQKKKIVKIGVPKQFKEKKILIGTILHEIESGYQRVMCDLECRRLLGCYSTLTDDLVGMGVTSDSQNLTTKLKTSIIASKHYKDVREYLMWNSIYVQDEVHEALQAIGVECVKVSEMLLYSIKYPKPQPIEEFETQQLHSIHSCVNYLKTDWIKNISQSMRMCLRHIGKGWFDLNQKKYYIYNVMKLKRVMELVRQRMQISIRQLIERSVKIYLTSLETPMLPLSNLEDDFTWDTDLKDNQYKPKVNLIFELELGMNKDGPFYGTNIELFKDKIDYMMVISLQLCLQIKQVHPLLMTNLRFAKNLYINSVSINEPLIAKTREMLKKIYAKGIIPLKTYLSKYHVYQEIFNLDVDKYIEEFEADDYTIPELKEEVLSQLSARKRTEQEIPKSVAIGAFNVNVDKLRKYLVEKRQTMANRLLDMHARILQNRANDVLNEFRNMWMKLTTEPETIEQLFEIREWMDSLPMTISGLADVIQKLKMDYDILDMFSWNLSDEDFECKWDVLKFPHRIQVQAEKTFENLNLLEKETFLKNQLSDQNTINDRIESLMALATNFMLQFDLSKAQGLAKEIDRNWDELLETVEWGLLLNSRQKLFGLPVVPFERLTRLVKEFEPYKNFWLTTADWLHSYETWMHSPLIKFDGSNIETKVVEMLKTISKCIKIFQQAPEILHLAVEIKNQMEEFRPYIVIIESLRNPGMKERHFEALSQKIGFELYLTPELTFEGLLKIEITKYEEIIQEISETAAKEFAIEQALHKMLDDWESITMEVVPYKETGTYIMKLSDDVGLLLDDHVLTTQQLSFSPFKAFFVEEIDNWSFKLKITRQVLTLWIEVQKLWMYLEPIFSSEDISRQLPVEAKKYSTMERNWRRVMKMAFENPVIIKICPDRTLLESLRECMGLLEVVQKGLADYLESRRIIFPRFFFLSDDELLEILAQAKNVQAVQPHLKKCFESMKELRFEEDLTITRMYSPEGEEVVLDPPVIPQGSVEYWLGTVESSMRNTIRFKIKEALGKLDSVPRKDWVFMWPGQISLCGGQFSWTAQVEKAISHNDLAGYKEVMIRQLDDLRELIRDQRTDIERMMLEAIITIEVHARDVLFKLIEEEVHSVNDFEWISQLRYYWSVDNHMKIRAVNAEFQYEYEYLGNNGRLVITPLTDRCYLTLTGALHLKLGGAPAGPAGTGKTETTKDLAKAFAIQCVVFNCSDQLDYMSMGKFFKGLASSGAWACFDEFNRIDIEVLSVIAQQYITIQKAQQLKAERFFFEGVEIALRPSCAAFVTMNPGYAGRSELPDNLKALFRPVAMMVPNYSLIAEISLFSCGFVDAKSLATKITATFKLSSEQLSSQDHYDFGMRSVKTVIAVAGILKREQKDMTEPQICLRALRDANMPKFLKDDLILFNGIVSDLFPGIVEKTIDYTTLEDAIKNAIKDLGLAPIEDFIKKVIQLYETTIVRHGLMLVGPTGAGKTKCYEVLKYACTKLKGKLQPSGKPFTTVHTYILNPKSITMGQLYGEYDLNTHEWTDGIFSTLIREGTAVTDSDKRWYIFDGPVDAVWIENMNTVLDDNKKLCLSSGEIMRLTPYQTMMFEVADLKVASPATVSRCGMVYMEPAGLGITPFIDCWVKKLPAMCSAYTATISDLAYALILPGLTFLRENLTEIVTCVDAGLVQAYFNLMNYQINQIRNPDPKEFPGHLIEPWSSFAFVWSLGATCDYNSRLLFSHWLRELQNRENFKVPFPSKGVVHDYKLIMGAADATEENEKTRWKLWLEDTGFYPLAPDKKFSDIEIPTIDMVRSAAIMDYLLNSECNLLCVGPTGSGKTLTIAKKLSREMPKRFISDFIVFSARTSANQTQDLIDSKLDKRRKGAFGPQMGKRQVFFIDDLNMPALEVYGAQPPIELLRQFMDFKGWYDRKEIGFFRRIEDVNFLCAMGPPGGGRNPITPRLLRHFHYLAFPEMEDSVKRTIFGTILYSWLIRTASLEDILEPILSITIRVFSTICKELLPTPEKSHYTFNVRDLGRVFQGILMADPEKIYDNDDLFVLWFHENFRVYSDRLTNEPDRKWFRNLLRTNIKDEFDYDIDDILSQDSTLFFGDFCNPEGRYERIVDTNKMQDLLVEFLDDYNAETTVPMNLVLFEDAMGHICKITRILRQSPGNALLLGMGGSGRQSLTKLSTHIAEYNIFQIELSKAYSTRDWRDDIKDLLLKTGLPQKPTVFLFSDTQIKDNMFLEDINNILNTGDVPNIYQPEEMDQVFQAMRAIVQESGLPLIKSNLLAAFQKVLRNNLHVVLSMCPIGENFRSQIRQFPALVNLCTIDWFDPWPDSALQSVANHFLRDLQDASITPEILSAIVRTCQFMHSSVIKASIDFLQEMNRHNYVTPTCFLELISSYGDLLERKRNELNTGISRLSIGLEKLASTEIEVKEMQILLEKMKPELAKAAVVAAEMMKQIAADTEEAEVTRAKAAEQELEAATMKKKNQIIKDDAEDDLDSARPMLQAAEASLKALNKGDITEVKALKRPPPGVVLVIEAICIIRRVKPKKIPGEKPGEKLNDYWTPGSLMLADAGQFLATLENFNKDDLTEDIIKKLKVYIENPDFNPEKIQKVSKACHSLCLWIHAMYNWYFVMLRVKPKMEALKTAEEELARTKEILAAAMRQLQLVQDGLDLLQMKFHAEEKKKAELERQQQLCADRMSRAVRLVSGLSGEQKRWVRSVAQTKEALAKVIGDILLSAGAIAYLTPFVDSYRIKLLRAWYELLGNVPHTEGCTPVSILGQAVEIRSWHVNGLPRDSLSVENAVLVMNSKRWALFIDPQGQANRWIRNMGAQTGAGLSVVRMTDKDLLRVVESCVRFGRTCLIENVGLDVEASLDTVFMRSVFKQAGQISIKIGDNIVPYNFDFRLYLTTKLPNPHYPPEIAVKLLLVNFTLTSSGLADQMLSLVVMQERPDLEETRSALVVANAQMARELKEIEDRILYRLSVSEGSAVDDEDLILTLEASKIKSEEIKLKVQSAEITQVDIDAARSLYIPVADRAQILFFCLSDLQQVDPMYQYSLEWYIQIFINSMALADRNEDVITRGRNINDYFTYSLYSNVCRSLFEKNKLQFAFLLCIRIQMMNNLIDSDEWRFLLSGAIPPNVAPNPAPEWLTERCWTEIQSLAVLPRFKNFVSSFDHNLHDFKIIFDARDPEIEKYPAPWEDNLNDLQKMLVLKCLRPDKLMVSIQYYITKHLGARFIEPQTAGLDAIYKESTPLSPLIFILSSGTDPASELFKFAEKLKMSRKLFSVSLGQGQGPRAELMLRQSIEIGNWVFFQNCHLAPSWLPKLELLIESLPPDLTHQNFRLWLTSMPSAAFPVSILQNGSKMTVEPPRGIKANVLRTYQTQVIEMKDFFESEHPKLYNFKTLLHSLCLFHSILLERRKFGPLGFNIPYEFTDGDFSICMSQLHMFLMEYDIVPYKVLIYTAGHINYGGRITDDWDRRCVLTTLENFYNSQVLTPGFMFDSQGDYVQPSPDLNFNDYIALIKNFPMNDDPELFGLHANANISYAQAETYSSLSVLLDLQPKEIGAATLGKEDVTASLANSILKEIPEILDLAEISKRYPVSYEESLNTVLLHEATRYNALLKEMLNSLKDLLKALKGLVVMSETLDTMATALFSNRVPDNWKKKAFSSLKPLGSWVEDLKQRVKFIRTWKDEGMPTAFWISGFYFPQAFLTGVLQNYARKYGVSIDSISFAFEVLAKKPSSRPSNGAAVYGLFLEGCRWDGVSLAESYPKELYTSMPPILFLPEVNHEISPDLYECPVYKTVVRAGVLSTTGHSTNFVLPVEIPTVEPPEHWTVRGVALICALNF